jgi:hypothetical protein
MSTRKVKLADVLWDAANKHLTDGEDEDGCDYTCEAIAYAAKHGWASPDTDEHATWFDFIANHAAMHFVRELGCDTGRAGQFNDFRYGEERQGVRYMWLLLAMHVAEDERIEIEVQS